MSALLAHAKAFRALEAASLRTVQDAGTGEEKHRLQMDWLVYQRAAAILEQQARDEASGNGEKAK